MKHSMSTISVIALLALGTMAAAAQEEVWVGPEMDLAPKAAERQPLRIGEIMGGAPVMVLPSALDVDMERVHHMVVRNMEGHLPLQNGLSRAVPEPQHIVLTGALLNKRMPVETHQGWVDRSPEGNLVFTVRTDLVAAHAVRLHLADVNLPKQTRLWVYGPGQPAVRFGTDMVRETRDLWCPAVYGTEAWLEVEIPFQDLEPGVEFSFTIDRVLELFPPELIAEGGETGVAKTNDFSCLVDGMCQNLSSYSLGSYDTAVAHLQFEVDGDGYICTGGLVNDKDVDGFIPYLLTANHCFSTQASANTLDTYWDYKRSSCNGTEPLPYGFPRVAGATLLATNEASDFTFVRLSSSPPSPRSYLGWSSAAQGDGTTLHRLSHPDGKPQAYSRSTLATTGTYTCSDAARPDYIYSLHTMGSTWGGSSGAPVVKEQGVIVGQLTGKCGPEGFQDCDNTVPAIDGAFSTTYDYVSSWINPGGTVECSSTISLNQTVNGSWSSSCTSTHKPGSYAKYYTFTLPCQTQVQIDLESSVDTYLFLLNGSGSSGSVNTYNDDVNGTNTDSRIVKTLAAGTYTIEATTFSAATAGTFTVSLAGSCQSEPCVANGTTLCLNNDRFKVTATWRSSTGSGTANAVELTGDTGYFWFFDQTNVEVVTKVINGCPLNQNFWVFAAGLTNVEVTLTVVDTDKGETWTRKNPISTPFQPIQDTAAFDTCN